MVTLLHHRAAGSSALVLVFVLSRLDAGLTVMCDTTNLENLITEDDSAPQCCLDLADLDATMVDQQ